MTAIKTMLITSAPLLAAEAEAAGVSRIMVDMEYIGKKERQKNLTAHAGVHQKGDVAKVRASLKKAELVVRVNPWHEGSKAEIDYAVEGGADIIMLPMIEEMGQFARFIDTLGKRAKPLPLVETRYSMEHIGDIAANPAVDELYIGFNDLHLSLGLDFLFEPLALGLVDIMASTIKSRGKKFGFGGIAAIGGGDLPARNILGEHARLGSTCVILSSQFGRDIRINEPSGREQRLAGAVNILQEAYRELIKRPLAQQQLEARQTFAIIETLAEKARNQRKPQTHATS
jgi:2-keto-3-deoxy-L-rhamnonate aldolase RhmA